MIRIGWMAAALAVSSMGCTFLVADEADKKQCRSNADCDRIAGETGLYTCSTNSFCERVQVQPDAGMEGPTACEQDADCREVGEGFLCGFDGFCYEKWGCIDDDVDWPKPPTSFTYRATLRSLTNPEDPSLVGDTVEAKACIFGDSECLNPIATGTADAEKKLAVRFTGFSGDLFNGTIRITDGSPPETPPEQLKFLPGYVHFGPTTRLVGDLYGQDRVLLIDETRFKQFGQLGVNNNDGVQTVVIILAYDCGGQGAAGVSMSVQGSSDYTFIAIQGESGVAPTESATLEGGIGSLLGVPGGVVKIVLTDEASGTEVGTVGPAIVPNAINYIQFYPRYSAQKAWLDEAERNPSALP